MFLGSLIAPRFGRPMLISSRTTMRPTSVGRPRADDCQQVSGNFT
jgi:hypothetical protein